MSEAKTRKTLLILSGVLFLAISIFCLGPYKAYQERKKAEKEAAAVALKNAEAQKRIFAKDGDGHFLHELMTMSDEKRKTMVDMIGKNQCTRFVEFVGYCEDESAFSECVGELDFGLEKTVIADLSQLQGVSGEEIWEAFKEINLKVKHINAVIDGSSFIDD